MPGVAYAPGPPTALPPCGCCGGPPPAGCTCATLWAKYPQLYATIDVPCFGPANQGSFPLTFMAGGSWGLLMPAPCGYSIGAAPPLTGLTGWRLFNLCSADGGGTPTAVYIPYVWTLTTPGLNAFGGDAANYLLVLARDGGALPPSYCEGEGGPPVVDLEFDVIYRDLLFGSPPPQAWARNCCFADAPGFPGYAGLPPRPPVPAYQAVGKFYVTD